MYAARQVADMLRERLQSVGSDLIDAKTRVTELEAGQAADREALRRSHARLSEASTRALPHLLGLPDLFEDEQMQKFVDALKHQQQDRSAIRMSA